MGISSSSTNTDDEEQQQQQQQPAQQQQQIEILKTITTERNKIEESDLDDNSQIDTSSVNDQATAEMNVVNIIFTVFFSFIWPYGIDSKDFHHFHFR